MYKWWNRARIKSADEMIFISERDQAVHLPVLLDYALLREEHTGVREVVYSHEISASPILRAYFVARDLSSH